MNNQVIIKTKKIQIKIKVKFSMIRETVNQIKNHKKN